MTQAMTFELPLEVSARHLRAVIAVAENRSFIAAAAYLRISQPALTRMIKHIEQLLGVTLFSRTTRSVAPTQAGRDFVALAERLLNDLKLGVTHLRARSSQHSGQVIVSSVLPLADAVLPQLIVDFRKRYPGIQIHLRQGIHREVLDEVRNGVADFGIGYVDQSTDDVATEPLVTERLHLVMPAKHPLAKRSRIETSALEGLTFVSFPGESRTRYIVDRAAAANGFQLQYAVTANRLPALLMLVRNGIGLAVVPASERPDTHDRTLVSKPLSGARFGLALGVLRSKQRALSPAAAILLVIVRRWLKSASR